MDFDDVVVVCHRPGDNVELGHPLSWGDVIRLVPFEV
jgi:hypothetical protein